MQPDISKYSRAGQPLDIHERPTSVIASQPLTFSRCSPGQPSPNAFNNPEGSEKEGMGGAERGAGGRRFCISHRIFLNVNIPEGTVVGGQE